MTLRDLRLRVRAIFTARRVEQELGDELSFHIERETQKHIDAGLSRSEAHARACVHFGSLPLAAEQCRDARGISLLDSVVRDVLYALRAFRRAPLAALTVVTTVALGLGLVAVVFTFFNTFVLRVDDVRNPGQLHAVERTLTPGATRIRFTRPQFEALRRDNQVFADIYAELADVDSRIDGRMMSGTLVSGNFFQTLGVSAAVGRVLTPLDDERSAPRPVMVLSHRGWSRLFSSDPAAVGRTLTVNGRPYQVVGVTAAGFRGLDVAPPDYWAPLSLLGEIRPIHLGREDRVGIDIVGRLRPGVSRQAAVAALAAWDLGGVEDPASPRAAAAARMTVEPRRGSVHFGEALVLFTPIFFAFGLVLLIGCANVTNLLLARAVSRQREIGTRLALGASRRRIVRQLLTESVLLALVAAALGYVISRVILEGTLRVVMTTVAPEIAELIAFAAPAADWRVWMFLVVAAVISSAFFGLTPALQATRLDLVRAIRGEVWRDARPRRTRNVLIGLQVGASTLLLICSAVFLRSAAASAMVDPGVRTADTVLVDIINEPLREAMIQAVRAEPAVSALAASSPDALSRPRVAFAGSASGRVPVAYRTVSAEYFDVLGIAVVRGRGFSQTERASGAGVVVVSEKTARQMWPGEDALGQVLRLEEDADSEVRREGEPSLSTRAFTVIGVVRDVQGFRLAAFNEAGVYMPTDSSAANTSLTVRVVGDPDQARRALLQRLTAIDPNMGQVITMRTLARMETYLLKSGFWLTAVVGGLALVLTLSGLFSVLSYIVEQRRKEIGVRMALGATTKSVALLVVSQSLRPVGFGLVVGAGAAAALATMLLSTPAAAQIGAIVHVLDPMAYTLTLNVIIGACALAAAVPAWHAARTDPITTLRQD